MRYYLPLDCHRRWLRIQWFRLFVVSGKSAVLDPYERHSRKLSNPTDTKSARIKQLRYSIELCVTYTSALVRRCDR